MLKNQILFSLEQEAKYRKFISSLLTEVENQEFRKNAGILINMTIHQIAIYLLDIKETDENNTNIENDVDYEVFKENYRLEHGKEYDFYEYFDENFEERVYEFADFSFLSCYITDWLFDKELEQWRTEIEKREFSITGKVSNVYVEECVEVVNRVKSFVSFQQMASKISNQNYRKKASGFGRQT